jgi:hypothetical protein
MTYLNDVTDAGETEWYYQEKKIKPKNVLLPVVKNELGRYT